MLPKSCFLFMENRRILKLDATREFLGRRRHLRTGTPQPPPLVLPALQLAPARVVQGLHRRRQQFSPPSSQAPPTLAAAPFGLAPPAAPETPTKAKL